MGLASRAHIKYQSICLRIVISCIGVTILLTGCTGSGGSSTALSGHILIVGSTALQPLALKAASSFESLHPQVKVDVSGGGSVLGLESVTGQHAPRSDIGDSDLYADPAIYPDPNLTDHIVCVSPFTMVTGPGVTITSLTKQQIIDIFSTGKIRNWQEVGGPDLPIIPVVRPPTSGTRATFRKYILDGRDENGQLLKTDSSTDVRNMVAHTAGAIGYLALSVLDSSVHAVAIDNKTATPENIAAGSYNFWSYEHMYTLGNDNALVNAFLDFMLNASVQQQAQKLSYIPIANMKLPQVGVRRDPTSARALVVPGNYESEVSLHESE